MPNDAGAGGEAGQGGAAVIPTESAGAAGQPNEGVPEGGREGGAGAGGAGSPNTAVGGAAGAAGASGAGGRESELHCLGVPEEALGYWTLDSVDAGSVADAGRLGLTGTVVGATATAGKIGGGLEFNGTSYVTIPSTSLRPLDGLSLVAWVKPSTLSSGSFWNSVLGVGSSSTAINPYWLGYHDSNLEAFSTNGTTDISLEDVGGHSNHIGSWHHIALTYDRETGRMVLYADGISTAEKLDPNGLVYPPTTTELLIGMDKNAGQLSQPFWGAIDEVKVFSCPLSAEQVERDFTANWPFEK